MLVAEYKCNQCKELFNWSEDSWVYGMPEYKWIDVRKSDEKHFCSTTCKNKFKEQ